MRRWYRPRPRPRREQRGSITRPTASPISPISSRTSPHYSRFDCEAGGQQVWGQATQNLPQYVLRVDGKGEIYAEGVDELLYGRLSNVL